MHSHDVRALAIWPPYAPFPQAYQRRFPIDIAPVLASGGLDMSVVVTPAALPSSTVVKIVNPLSTSIDSTFGDSYHRRLAYTSGPSSTSALKIARQGRLVSCMRDAAVSIWRILQHSSASDEEALQNGLSEGGGGWEKVLEMDFNVHTNLTASAISDDGRWLVVSDLYETKLFVLETDVGGDTWWHLSKLMHLFAEPGRLEPKTNTRLHSSPAAALTNFSCVSGRCRFCLHARLLEAGHVDCHVFDHPHYQSR